jgi:hypothetical protein
LQIRAQQCGELLERLVATGAVERTSAGEYCLSVKGREDYQRLLAQREGDLKTMLAGWKPEEHPEVMNMMRELARSFASSPPSRP